MLDQCPHQRLDALVRHQRDLHPPRVLQARGKEVDLLLAAIVIGDPDLAKVVLRNSPGSPSNRTNGVTVRTRSVCANAYTALLPPVYPASRARCSSSTDFKVGS